MILVGNKSDLEAEVTDEEAESFATEHGCQFYKTSAVDGTNISLLFQAIS